MLFDPENFTYSDDVIRASAAFRQGDVVRDVIFGFVASAEAPITQEARETVVVDGHIGVIRKFDYAMVLTQTCDLQQEDRVRENPFINIAPVFDVYGRYDPDDHATIRKGQYKFLLPVDAKTLGLEEDGGHLWVADIRTDIAVERSVLLGKIPLRAFANETDYIDAIKKLGAYRIRPAFAVSLETEHLVPLQKAIRGKKPVRRAVLEVWLRCAPSFLEPATAKLFFIIGDETQRQMVQDFLDEWYPVHMAETKATVRLTMPEIVIIEHFGRKQQRGALEVDLYRRLSSEEHR